MVNGLNGMRMDKKRKKELTRTGNRMDYGHITEKMVAMRKKGTSRMD